MDCMLGDMFATEDDVEGGQMLSTWERLPRNCADKLPLPELGRKEGYPIGLKNQGATCYLNSLLQVLFHTPEFRQTILRLPLCLDTAEKPSTFVNEAKQSFLLGFQRLFSEMSKCDQKSVGTDYLNKAFKWQGEQHREQQDIQQAMRVIFDTIVRALYGTEHHETAQALFRGITLRYKTCMNCGQTSERPEQFFDLSLQVKNINSVKESLKAMMAAESMDGDNAIFCDTCQSKQSMWLGTRLQSLPGTFVLTLNRFDFDYEKMDRVKLNSLFQFPLELDMSEYLTPHAEPNYHKYELYGVVIHRGSAQGGHYFCYARDLLHETNWESGLVETNQQEAKAKSAAEAKEKEKEEKQESKGKEEEEKEHKIEEPVNKALLENWYQINDNIATAISANKLSTKYEGSESAYILFYRRKTLTGDKKAQVPEYFANPIREAAKVMQKERDQYQVQKKQIILTIEGEDHKLSTSMSISDFKEAFIAEGVALVMQSDHNGLPYYPMQVVNHPEFEYKQDETILSLAIPHETRWKKYDLISAEYKDILPGIGKDRLPLELLLLLEGEEPRRIVSYSDENFLMLRMKIEKLLSISYQNQIISLISPYKTRIISDDLSNDDLLLSKLGIFHTSQLQIKSKQNEQEEGGKQEKKDLGDLICFVIERDEVIGLKRFYFEKTKTLEELVQHFKNMEGIKDQHKRRVRNLNGNRLFYTGHFEMTLEELEFSEELVRLRLERGEIPVKGDVLVKFKNQSTLFKKEGDAEEEIAEVEKIFDPNCAIREVKEWVCQEYHLEVALHKLYLTDWVKQPIRSLTREHLTLFEANFSREETVCLRDIYSPIGQELVHLQVYNTTSGCPDTAEKDGIHVKIEQFKTVNDLKELLINTLQLSITPDRLRVREIKRDYMFGSIWRDSNKSVKSVTVNSNKIVYQVLEEPEQLTESQIVVVLKIRNREKRLYEGVKELVFQAGKVPNIEDFTDAVKNRLELQEDVTITKYVHHEFEWIELSRKNIELLAKKKKGKQQNKKKGEAQPGKKGEKAENKKKEEGDTEKQGKDDQAEWEKKRQEKRQKKARDEKLKEKETQNTDNQSQKTQDKQVKENEVKKADEKVQKPKKEKGGKGGKGEHKQKEVHDESQNLRKAPILLKDGDMIGWGLASELQGDDLQTDEDAALRITLKNQPGKFKAGKEKGFVLGVGF